jgi:hypothetical protein
MPKFDNPYSGIKLDKEMDENELIRAIRFAISAEYEAAQLYTQIAEVCNNEKAIKVLNDITKEELVHAGEFMAVLKELNPEEEDLYKEGEKEVKNIKACDTCGDINNDFYNNGNPISEVIDTYPAKDILNPLPSPASYEYPIDNNRLDDHNVQVTYEVVIPDINDVISFEHKGDLIKWLSIQPMDTQMNSQVYVITGYNIWEGNDPLEFELISEELIKDVGEGVSVLITMIQAHLIEKVNKKTGNKEWCLVSKKDNSKVLKWFGSKKPSKKSVQKEEKRIQYYKAQGADKMEIKSCANMRKVEIDGKSFVGLTDGKYVYLNDSDAIEAGIDKIKIEAEEKIEAKEIRNIYIKNKINGEQYQQIISSLTTDELMDEIEVIKGNDLFNKLLVEEINKRSK